jgi:hypothetical protein
LLIRIVSARIGGGLTIRLENSKSPPRRRLAAVRRLVEPSTSSGTCIRVGCRASLSAARQGGGLRTQGSGTATAARRPKCPMAPLRIVSGGPTARWWRMPGRASSPPPSRPDPCIAAQPAVARPSAAGSRHRLGSAASMRSALRLREVWMLSREASPEAERPGRESVGGGILRPGLSTPSDFRAAAMSSENSSAVYLAFAGFPPLITLNSLVPLVHTAVELHDHRPSRC